MALLSTDEGAAALAASAPSDAHGERFVAHLRTARAMKLATATGGASLLNPAALGLATPFSAAPEGALPGPETASLDAADEALANMDVKSLCRYITSLVPSTADGHTAPPVLVDCVAGSGVLTLRLGAGLPTCHIYAACDSAARAGRVQRALDASTRSVSNVTPVVLDGQSPARDGGVSSLPVSADVVVATLCCDALLADDCALLKGLATKMRSRATLLCMEEDPESLDALQTAATRAGLTLAASPTLNSHFARAFRAMQ